jgi:hypothetical protein
VCNEFLESWWLTLKYRNKKDFSSDDVYALAIFVVNCYSGVSEVCQCFDAVVSIFIRKGLAKEDELHSWHDGLDWDLLQGRLQQMKQPPEQPVSWNQLTKPTENELTNYIRRALGRN